MVDYDTAIQICTDVDWIRKRLRYAFANSTHALLNNAGYTMELYELDKNSWRGMPEPIIFASYTNVWTGRDETAIARLIREWVEENMAPWAEENGADPDLDAWMFFNWEAVAWQKRKVKPCWNEIIYNIRGVDSHLKLSSYNLKGKQYEMAKERAVIRFEEEHYGLLEL